jgi:hypothetical protein
MDLITTSLTANVGEGVDGIAKPITPSAPLTYEVKAQQEAYDKYFKD